MRKHRRQRRRSLDAPESIVVTLVTSEGVDVVTAPFIGYDNEGLRVYRAICANGRPESFTFDQLPARSVLQIVGPNEPS